jgi:hypothetical protein
VYNTVSDINRLNLNRKNPVLIACHDCRVIRGPPAQGSNSRLQLFNQTQKPFRLLCLPHVIRNIKVSEAHSNLPQVVFISVEPFSSEVKGGLLNSFECDRLNWNRLSNSKAQWPV